MIRCHLRSWSGLLIQHKAILDGDLVIVSQTLADDAEREEDGMDLHETQHNSHAWFDKRSKQRELVEDSHNFFLKWG